MGKIQLSKFNLRVTKNKRQKMEETIMNKQTIEINKSVVYGIIAVFIAAGIFAAGMLTVIGIYYHNNVVAESQAYEQTQADKKASQEAINQLHAQKLNSVSTNVQRDLNADLYAVQIFATKAIAAQYQEAKMCNTLDNPDVRANLYNKFQEAVDIKTQEYLDTYSLATEAASKKSFDYTMEYTTMNQAQSEVHKMLLNANKSEQQWQSYNSKTLLKKAEELKTEVGNKILSNEVIF